MKQLFSFIFTLLIILLISVLAIAFLIGWSLGLGWVLGRIVPALSLFEAGLLAMIATCAVLYIAVRVTMPLPDATSKPFDDDFWDDDDDDEGLPLPLERFQEGDTAVTQETSFRHQIANTIYLDMVANPERPQMMNNTQLEALAMRLTDVVVAILKRKPRNTPRVSVTISAMKKEMDRMGQRPYDDDILQMAVGAANVRLAFDDELADIVREKSWREEYDDD